eukprot:3862209-Prorocentrum_lima.AAC.1
MTSSLVGSEMCIRDSRFVEQRAYQRSSAISARLPAIVRDMCTTLHAVSYTHLTLPTICSV